MVVSDPMAIWPYTGPPHCWVGCVAPASDSGRKGKREGGNNKLACCRISGTIKATAPYLRPYGGNSAGNAALRYPLQKLGRKVDRKWKRPDSRA